MLCSNLLAADIALSYEEGNVSDGTCMSGFVDKICLNNRLYGRYSPQFYIHGKNFFTYGETYAFLTSEMSYDGKRKCATSSNFLKSLGSGKGTVCEFRGTVPLSNNQAYKKMKNNTITIGPKYKSFIDTKADIYGGCYIENFISSPINLTTVFKANIEFIIGKQFKINHQRQEILPELPITLGSIGDKAFGIPIPNPSTLSFKRWVKRRAENIDEKFWRKYQFFLKHKCKYEIFFVGSSESLTLDLDPLELTKRYGLEHFKFTITDLSYGLSECVTSPAIAQISHNLNNFTYSENGEKFSSTGFLDFDPVNIENSDIGPRGLDSIPEASWDKFGGWVLE